MEELNNPESEIYKQTLEQQNEYIDTKLGSSKMAALNDNMRCSGTKEEIVKHLNQGSAPNLIKVFFKTTDNCDICKGKKGENNIMQLERAHCNIIGSRSDLLMMAINDLYTDNNTPIKVGDILKLFIQKHKICPLYTLCNLCHNKYDKPKKR